MIRLQFDKIERIRKDLDLTQAAVAEAGMIHVRTYRRLLRNTRNGLSPNFNSDTANGISNALGVHFFDIVEYIPDPRPQ